MNVKDREIMEKHGAILERLDERSLNTWRTVEDLKKGQDRQNGTLLDHESRIATVEGAGGIGTRAKVTGGLAALTAIAWNVYMWLRQQPPI